MLKKIEIILEVLLKSRTQSPFLDTFNQLVRENALQECREIFVEEFDKHKKTMSEVIHPECDDQIIPQPVMQRLVRDIDSLFKAFHARMLERETTEKQMTKPDFQKLKLSESLMNLIPKDSDHLAPIYELCVRWVLKVEYNWDLILRAKSYGLVNASLNGKSEEKRKNDTKLPHTIIKVHYLNGFMRNMIDKTIHNIFSSTTATISQKVNKVIIGGLLTAIFGATMVTVGGFVVSFVDLPFNVDFDIFDWAVEPLVTYVKKTLKIGEDNISAYLLHEAINQTEQVNADLESKIELLSKLQYSDKRFDTLKKNLNNVVNDLIENKKYTSNVRAEEPPVLDVIYREHNEGPLEGWTEILDENDDYIKLQEREDGFFDVELKEDVCKMETKHGGFEDEFQVINDINEPQEDNTKKQTTCPPNPYSALQTPATPVQIPIEFPEVAVVRPPAPFTRANPNIQNQTENDANLQPALRVNPPALNPQATAAGIIGQPESPYSGQLKNLNTAQPMVLDRQMAGTSKPAQKLDPSPHFAETTTAHPNPYQPQSTELLNRQKNSNGSNFTVSTHSSHQSSEINSSPSNKPFQSTPTSTKPPKSPEGTTTLHQPTQHLSQSANLNNSEDSTSMMHSIVSEVFTINRLPPTPKQKSKIVKPAPSNADGKGTAKLKSEWF